MCVCPPHVSPLNMYILFYVVHIQIERLVHSAPSNLKEGLLLVSRSEGKYFWIPKDEFNVQYINCGRFMYGSVVCCALASPLVQ